nr:type I-C CRISPR-associated protein Cas8c/Csd1 [Deinococcus yavapaiensis]
MFAELLEYYARNVAGQDVAGYQLGRPDIIAHIENDELRLPLIAADETIRPVLFPKLAASRTNRSVAALACDTAEYSLGIPRDAKSPDRHRAFLESLEQAVRDTNHPALTSLLTALRKLETPPELPQGRKAQQMLVFLVDGNHVHDDPALQAYWQQTLQTNARQLPDAVTGQNAPFTQRLPATTKIRGVPGARGNGKRESPLLASANEKAFDSYGLENSFGTGLSTVTAERLAKAIQGLLDDTKHRVYLRNASFVYWTNEADELSLEEDLFAPSPEHARQLLAAPISGHHPPTLDAAVFQGLLLASNTGRLIVRGRVQEHLPVIQARVRTFLRRTTVPYAGTTITYGIRGMLESATHQPSPATGRKSSQGKEIKGSKLPPHMDEDLLSHVLQNTLLSASLPIFISTRAKTPKHITPGLAALAQLTLFATHVLSEGDAMTEPPSPADLAYRTGQLLAVAEYAQRRALGKVGTTVADRMFGLAAQNPAQAIGLIVTATRPHLAKLRRTSPGLAYTLSRRIAELTAELTPDNVPSALSPEQKTAFVLGYYKETHSSGGIK